MVQITTRVPKTLHRELRLHCVESEVSFMQFVCEALAEQLKRNMGRKRRSP
jgi:predicted HicB family RNase H-like nuclease